jgi:hypothetical protein
MRGASAQLDGLALGDGGQLGGLGQLGRCDSKRRPALAETTADAR